MCKYFLFSLSLLLGSCGQAPDPTGLIANYRNAADGSTLKIEASNDNGARLQYSNQPFYMIVKGGEAYVVYTFAPKPRVTRVSDLQKVMAETPPSIEFPHDVIDKVTIELTGPATIAGYVGKAYSIRLPEGVSPRPVLVVSDDPKLRPIGAAFARLMDFSIATLRLSGKAIPPNFLRVRELIGQGTALRLAGYQLDKVEEGPINGKDFELPGAPMSIPELRQNARALARLQHQ